MEKCTYGVILDVCSLDEYKDAHIEGATLLHGNEIKVKTERALPNEE